LSFPREKTKTAAIHDETACPDRFGWLLPLAMVVAIAAFLVRETIDADTWWQVAIGRDILAHLAVPRTDHFAAAAWGRPYHDSHWLFQVFLALFDRLGGMRGASVAMVGLWSATLYASYRAVRRWQSADVAAILVFVAAIACSDRFTPRPDLVTCLMIALFYLRLQEGRYCTPADLAVFALLQVLWSNSHGLFVIGPFMAGCYLLAALVGRFRGGAAGADLSAAAKLCGLVTLATLLTPYGLGGWRYALLLMQEAGPAAPAFFRKLAELTPTFGPKSLGYPDFWGFVLILLLFLLTTVWLLRKGNISPARLLLVVAMAVTATSGRRNIPLFALTAVPLVAENLRHCLPRLCIAPRVRLGVLLLVLSLAWFPLSGRYYRIIGYPLRFGLGASSSLFPPGLAVFLRESGFSGQIYNGNYLGGYCLYHGYRPLFDGRWETYDEKTLKAIFDAPSDPAAFERLVTSYDIRGIMLLHESTEARSLLPRLAVDSRWRLAYLDPAASFWLRSDGTVRATLPAPASEPQRVEEHLMLATFYQRTGQPERALPLLDAALAKGGLRESTLERKGRALEELKRLGEAEAVFALLLQENGKNLAALNELAFLAYQRGDLQGAAAYLRRALAIKPDDRDIRANYERIVGTGGAR
jgi:tetratricopeptide repeat protein